MLDLQVCVNKDVEMGKENGNTFAKVQSAYQAKNDRCSKKNERCHGKATQEGPLNECPESRHENWKGFSRVTELTSDR